MHVRHTLRFAGALVSTNLKASFALRGAFWLQAVFMLGNNLMFFTIWWLFFDRFDDIRGWRLGDMAALYGLLALSFGLSAVFAGGTWELSRTIVEGDLDPYMTQPKSLLLHVVASRTRASGWGDIVSSFVLLGISGHVDAGTLPLVLLGALCGATVLTSTAVIVHSLAFWVGNMDTLARQFVEFTVMFSCYPRSIFAGAVRLLLFSLVPAGFVAYLPVELLRNFTWSGLGWAVGGAALYAFLAVFVFHAGLRRYESGNRFGVRA